MCKKEIAWYELSWNWMTIQSLIRRAYWQAISPVLFDGTQDTYHANITAGMKLTRAAEAMGVEL